MLSFLVNLLRKIINLVILICCLLLMFLRWVGYSTLGLEKLMQLECLAYILQESGRLCFFVSILLFLYQVSLYEQKKQFLKSFLSWQLLFYIIRLLLLLAFTYSILPGFLLYNALFVYGQLVGVSLLEIASTPGIGDVNWWMASMMEGKGSTEIPPSSEGPEKKLVASVVRLNNDKGQACLALRYLVESASSEKSFLGRNVFLKGFDVAQKVTGFSDTPCLDFDWPKKSMEIKKINKGRIRIPLYLNA